jgi:putative sugar O-methyltransferase
MNKHMTDAADIKFSSLSADCLAELEILLEDMGKTDRLFQPTQFWRNCSSSITSDLNAKGFTAFKSHMSSRTWFVPSYAKSRERPARRIAALLRQNLIPRGKLQKKIHDYYSGRLEAVADYRVARAATPKPSAFFQSGESRIGDGFLYEIEGVLFGKAALNYLRGLAFLQQTPGYFSDEARTFLEIGGGFGGLGEILLTNSADNRYINIDIPPVLSTSTYYLKALLGSDAVLSYEATRKQSELDIATCIAKFRATTLPPWQLPLLRGTVDCFVNFVSFQEMEPEIVKNYISLVMPLTRKYVILRNSRHGKRMASADHLIGVKKQTSLDMMIDWFSDFELVNRDSLVFGNESRFGAFRSEVAILKRKRPLSK